jgi:hypothetical protein
MTTRCLLTNVHKVDETNKTEELSEKTYLVFGNYDYYHYLCDGFDDKVCFTFITFYILLVKSLMT